MDHESKLVNIQKTVSALAELVQNSDDDDEDERAPSIADNLTCDVQHVNFQSSGIACLEDQQQQETLKHEQDAEPAISDANQSSEIGESDKIGEVDGDPLSDGSENRHPSDKVIIATGITKTRLRQLFQKRNEHPGLVKAMKERSWARLIDTAWAQVPFLTSWSEEFVKRQYLQVYAQTNRTVVVAPVQQQSSRGPVFKRLLEAGERRRSRVEKVKAAYRQEQQRQEELNCTFRPTLSPPPHSRKRSESPAAAAISEKDAAGKTKSPAPEPKPKPPKPKTVFCRLHEEAMKRLQRQMVKSATMKKMVESVELQGCTFHPAIWSQTSPRSGPVSQRLYEDAKRRDEYVNEIRAELDPIHDATFRPKVNARSRRLARQRSTGTVFQRLYRAKLRDPSPIRGRPPWV